MCGRDVARSSSQIVTSSAAHLSGVGTGPVRVQSCVHGPPASAARGLRHVRAALAPADRPL
eukprot:73161-Prymnesium_polylepis.2